MKEVSYTSLEPEEWEKVAELLNVAREFQRDLKAGAYKNAIDREITEGQKLHAMMTRLYTAIKDVPISVFAEAL